MALLKCGECGREVSTQAKKCPGCGAKVKKPVGPLGTILVVLLGVAVFVPLAMQDRNQSRPSPAPAPPAQTTPNLKHEAIANIKLVSRATIEGFGNVMVADLTITNKSRVNVKDLEITCDHFGASGTQIDRNTRIIYEIVPAGKTRSFPQVNMGFVHTQAARYTCSISDLVVVNK
jgi:hypothetical protein